VRLTDLASLVGARPGSILRAVSIETDWSTSLSHGQYGDERALLALRVNGADLSLDHGYPARVIVPGGIGSHNTKWVGELRFESA